MNDKLPTYNSRITRVYLKYLSNNYPDIDIDSVLKYSDMTKYEVEDEAHWFSQEQVDRFNEILVEKTGNPNIPREAGRYSMSSEALGAAKKYTVGLMSMTSVYLLMEKLYPIMSRGAVVKAKKLGPDKVEITCSPKLGVYEKPYQCENRIGIFESVGKLFTERFATIEHPSCYHKGDPSCRYIITWEKTPSLIWKRLRNISFLIGILVSLVFFFILPLMPWVFLVLVCFCLSIIISSYSEQLEKGDLIRTIETQGDAAKDLLGEINIRYNNALLIKEIGQATSRILDINKLIYAVGGAMQKRLDFDRGMIMLANQERTRLTYSYGYGYSKEKEELLRGIELHLDKPDSKGLFVLAFKDQKPFLINGMAEIEKNFSERSQELIKRMGVESIISVPIVYEKETLGILAVDNIKSKRQLTQSDVSLLMGVASQTAISISNALSFQKLQESEKKYRELVENANSIILRMKIDGTITFFNEFAQKFFGYEENEIIGKNAQGTILPDRESSRHDLEELVTTLHQEPELQIVRETENVRRSGDPVWVAWTYKPIFDINGNFKEILCIGNDITELKMAAQEKKNLETQLMHAQRMEAVGTLAGGIAHDFNNILQAIYGYTQILLMTKDPSDPDFKNLEAIDRSAQRASELTKRLLIFSRKIETMLMPLDLNQEVVQISKMLERMIPKMIGIELNLAANLQTINADAGQIEQVIINLGINAKDAMPEEGKLVFQTKNVTLDEAYCKLHLGSKPGEYVLLSVSDSGHGMEKEVLDHIFEPFFTTKETGKGTGLGLAMVYGIVKNHHGYITCESEPGRGAIFKIYFPAVEKEMEEVEAEEEASEIKGGSETILLVDDEENIRDLGQNMLARFGYTVITAQEGESAIELYQKGKNRVDLVILDLIMPGMGGRRCLEKLIDINPLIKVIIATGYSTDGTTKKEIKEWAKGFMDKPYKLRQMLETVREVLDGG
ncbi:MAG: PAS domain S-box protein [Pseudomonadota bacterium]